MLMMRLQRIGRKNEPHFRVVVTDKRNSGKSGKFVDIVGSYNPKSGSVTLNKETIESWIKKGVQLSGTVHNFLIDQKIIEGKKIFALPKRTNVKRKGGEAKSETPATA